MVLEDLSETRDVFKGTDEASAAARAIFLVGPTASGKTALAHALVDALPWLAPVNLDAFSFYRGVTAGTAKPTPAELSRYGYELVDFLDPPERFDAMAYADLARKAMARLRAQGRVPLCVGGSGLYLRALLHGLDDLPGADASVRARLRAEASASGWPSLHARLAEVDPARAAELHPNDSTRIERALEIFALTGKPMSTQRSGKVARPAHVMPDALVVHVNPRREWLRERIARRTRAIVGEEWRAEVEALHARYGEDLVTFQSMQAIGYLPLLAAVRGERPFAPAALAAEIETLTWQYARRQLTWNRKEPCAFAWSPEAQGERAPQDLPAFQALCGLLSAFLTGSGSSTPEQGNTP